MANVKVKDRPPAEPRLARVVEVLAAWASSPFGPRDDVDEADPGHVGGLRIVRAPDGSLVALDERKEKP